MKGIGGVVAALAAVVVLALALLDPGSSAPTNTSTPGSAASSQGSGSPTSGAGSASPGGTCAGTTVDAGGWTWVCLTELPRQAQQTVTLIDAGGPFPYAKDGSTFNNFEGLLPKQPKGYYREYTVSAPGKRDRGPRRIVTGDHDRELFYTEDHYSSFVRVKR